jgi:hypothetical protein
VKWAGVRRSQAEIRARDEKMRAASANLQKLRFVIALESPIVPSNANSSSCTIGFRLRLIVVVLPWRLDDGENFYSCRSLHYLYSDVSQKWWFRVIILKYTEKSDVSQEVLSFGRPFTDWTGDISLS